MTEEKRVRERVVYVIDTVFLPANGNKISGTVRDISMNGFYLITKQPQPKGTKGTLKIVLQLGDAVKTVQADCRVTRTEEKGMALTINKIDEEGSITLFNMIKFYL